MCLRIFSVFFGILWPVWTPSFVLSSTIFHYVYTGCNAFPQRHRKTCFGRMFLPLLSNFILQLHYPLSISTLRVPMMRRMVGSYGSFLFLHLPRRIHYTLFCFCFFAFSTVHRSILVCFDHNFRSELFKPHLILFFSNSFAEWLLKLALMLIRRVLERPRDRLWLFSWFSWSSFLSVALFLPNIQQHKVLLSTCSMISNRWFTTIVLSKIGLVNSIIDIVQVF